MNLTPDLVINLIIQAYPKGELPTAAQIHDNVSFMLNGPFAALLPHQEAIETEVLRRLSVRIGAASVLDNPTDHEPWLGSLDRSGWALWPRLRGYLRDRDGLPMSVLSEVDRSTDQVLERLESPARMGRWDRRGLVVGHVQSGKTTHYTALAAKAIDSGYRIVIILAGIHNSLRSQTHERIDRHLIGRDSSTLSQDRPAAARPYGVGDYANELALDEPPFSILTCTTSTENGDFSRRFAGQVWIQVNDGARLVMVVKKNATILRELKGWLKSLLAEEAAADGSRFIHHPTLFIDDEADHASINTKREGAPDEDPTTINGLIRQLLMSFARVGFVGYTATPFANIFIDPSSSFDKDKFGPDLFPHSFILSLKPPSDYVGPAVVFGHPGDESVGVLPQRPLPMYLSIEDADAWVPPSHKKDLQPSALPASLKQALRLFVINCAARAARGDIQVHNSMLVHATRFIDVQTRIASQIEAELTTLQNLVQSGSSDVLSVIESELREIWSRLVVANHADFLERLGDRCGALPTWDEVWRHLPARLQRIRVLRINGSSDDALAYARNTEGVSVVAIGGDKLSRGLTLEGLSVSYFLRCSNMFDTLMQMGRWFGYRPRYVDLCRVFTTRDLYGAFREISLAVDDLRSDLDRMALANRTPADFGLRIRTPSDGLLITAANKIRRGEPIQVRFAGELVQSLAIPRSCPEAAGNREALVALVTRLGPSKASRRIRGAETPWLSWSGVPASDVVSFLEQFTAYSTHSFLKRSEQLCRYINDRVAHDELCEWTVCVLSKGGSRTVDVGGLEIGLRIRHGEDSGKSYAMRAVVGSAEEAADLSDEEYAEALALTIGLAASSPDQPVILPKVPSREQVRQVRPASRGLLMLYAIDYGDGADEFGVAAAVSFPSSPRAQPLSYTVNPIWRAEYGFGEAIDVEE
jgi:hypothetical protein